MELLERSVFLDRLDGFLGEAAAGHGRLVFLSGEAGIGKTSLVQAFCELARAQAKVAVASCDALSTPGPLGPLIHLAPALGLSPDLLLRPEMSREYLYQQILSALAGAEGPTVLVGEDARWADEASLNLLRFLGRRVDVLPALLIVTFRDDELGPGHPLRVLRGDLASSPSVRRMSLPRLSAEAVQTLAANHAVDANALHQLTGGNPFFVTEVLNAGGTGLPASIRDAVLARVSWLSPASRRILDAVAVVGTPVEPALLGAITGGSAEAVTEEWLAVGIAERRADALAFRHELTREAILDAISPVRRLVLHRRILAAMEQVPYPRRDVAQLAHHAEAAGDTDAVLTYAAAAAEAASALGAHRQAAAQYARVLRFAHHLLPERRADLLERRSYECYLTGLLDDAFVTRQAALALRRETGDRLREGNDLRMLSRLHWVAGHNAEAERTASEALAVLTMLPPGPELAWAYSNLVAQLRMLAQDALEAIRWSEQAIELADRLGEVEILVHALNNVGTAKLTLEDESGRSLLERSLDLARRHGYEDQVGRAFVNLAWQALVHFQHDLAAAYLAEGIAYSTEHDLDTPGRYLLASRALLNLRRGDWSGAVTDAQIANQDPSAAPLTRIVALTVLGSVRARRGERDATVLDEALALGERTGELLRLGPLRAARAEAAWLAGDTACAIGEARAVLDDALHSHDRWLAGELMLTLHRAGERDLPVAGLAQPFADQIQGEWQRAAAHWQALGCPLETARALMEGDEAAVREAGTMFDRLGARIDAGMASKRLRDLGVHRLPPGLRPNPGVGSALLTQREMEVLRLLGVRATDREIADALFISPRTVARHVAGILAKLGVDNRRDAGAVAVRTGLI